MTTLNKWCRGDGSSVVCDQDTPSMTETDPEVGTLTASKWCTTNGTSVECTSDLPIGTLTNGKWCTTNGTTISCTTDAPTATAGADTQVIFNSGGILTGDAGFVWDNTNKRLGIGAASPSTDLHVNNSVGTPAITLGGNNTSIKKLVFNTLINSANKTFSIESNGGLFTISKAATAAALADGGRGVFANAGSRNSGNPFWQGWQFGAGDILTASGSNVFPLASHYWSYTNLADPTDLYYNIEAGNTSTLPTGIAIKTQNNGPILLSGGNVGIGTTAPNSKLDLGTNYSDPGTYPNKITLWSGGSNNYFGFGVSTGDLDYFSQSNHRFYTGYNGSAGTEKMTILDSGNVGIGVTDPARLLTVRGNSNGLRLETASSPTAYYSEIITNYNSVEPGYYKIGGQKVVGQKQMAGAAAETYLAGYYGISFATATQDPTVSEVRMFLNQAGKVGIGTMTPGNNSLNVAFSGAGAVTAGLALNDTSASGGGVPYIRFQANGTTIGSVAAAGASSVAYNTTSDRRLKKDIAPTQRGLADLMKIEVDDFEFSSDPNKDRVQGFIAQQLHEVYPEAVSVGGADAQTQPWAVDYGRLTPLLVKAMQELKAANDNLKADNAALRNSLDELRSRVEKLECCQTAKPETIR